VICRDCEDEYGRSISAALVHIASTGTYSLTPTHGSAKAKAQKIAALERRNEELEFKIAQAEHY